MSIKDHVSALKVKHQKLEADIHQESNRPLPDSVHLHELKQQKLKIKEEISKLTA